MKVTSSEKPGEGHRLNGAKITTNSVRGQREQFPTFVEPVRLFGL